MNFKVRAMCTAAVLLFLLSGTYGPGGAAPAAEPAPAEKGKTSEGAAEKGSGTGGTGQAPAESAPKPDKTAEAAAKADLATACKQAVTDLGAGDVSLKAIAAEKRATLVQGSTTARALMCLAIADDKSSYCDSLPKQGKAECLAQWELARELKALPKERVKVQIIYRACLANASKADCEKAREAMTAGTADKCKGLPQSINADFCAALATGDATKCNGLPQGAEREVCAAYVSDDPSRCPKDSVDCRNVVSVFAKLRKEGLEGFQDIDPTLAAARKGKQACAPVLAEFGRFCTEGK